MSTLPIHIAGALTITEAKEDIAFCLDRQQNPPRPVDPQSPLAERIAASRLDRALSELARAGESERHDTLLKKAAYLYGMIAGEWPLNPADVERGLFAAMAQNGGLAKYGEREVQRCINDARAHAPVIPVEIQERREQFDAPIDLDRTPADSPADSLTYYPDGVPNGLRSAMLDNDAFPDSMALLYELLNIAQQQGVLSSECTTRQVLDANVSTGVCMATATLYRMIEAGEGVFFSKLHSKESAKDKNILCKTEKNPGRPEHAYQLFDTATVERNVYIWKAPREIEAACPVDELLNEETSILAVPTTALLEAVGQGEAEAVSQCLTELAGILPEKGRRRAAYRQRRLNAELQDRHSTQLPHGWPLNNVVNFRTALLRGVIEENPDTELSNSKMARLLGVSMRAVHDYRRRAGLEAEPQDKPPVPVKSFDEVRAYGKAHNAFAYKLQAVTPDGEILRSEVIRSNFPAFIAEQRASGNHVLAEFGHPNKHRIVSDKPIEHHAPRREKPQPEREQRTPHPVERYYGPGHNPVWATRQIRLLYRKLTGQSPPGDALECIELLIGRELEESWAGFLADAAEMGAVASMTEKVA